MPSTSKSTPIYSTQGGIIFTLDDPHCQPSTWAAVRAAVAAGASLQDADLRGAELRDIDLRGADLRHADLRDANLVHADLRYADLSGADMREADLRGVRLYDTRFIGARMQGARIALHSALIGTDPVLSIGPIGSGSRMLTVFNTTSGLILNTGCFRGTLSQFERDLDTTHGSNLHAAAYRLAIETCKAIFTAQRTTSQTTSQTQEN